MKKLCIPFLEGNPLNIEAKEFDIKYRPQSNIDDLIYFLKTYSNIRINIMFHNDFDIQQIIDIISEISKYHSNVYIKMPYVNHKYSTILNLHNCNFYFFDKVADSKEILDELLQRNVSDVYITGDILHRLPLYYYYCKNNNCNVRIVLNHIQTLQTPRTTDVIYYPEEVEDVIRFFDTIEFDCGDPYNFTLLAKYYKIWFIDKKYENNMQHIIPNLDFPIYNEYIPHNFYFVEKNSKCYKTCQHQGMCRLCEVLIETANNLYKETAEMGI